MQDAELSQSCCICPKVVFKMPLLLVGYSLKIATLSNISIPFFTFALCRCHSYHIVNIVLMYILATSFTVFTLKMACCMCKSNI